MTTHLAQILFLRRRLALERSSFRELINANGLWIFQTKDQKVRHLVKRFGLHITHLLSSNDLTRTRTNR